MKKALFLVILVLLCLNISAAAQAVEIDIYKVPPLESNAVLMGVNDIIYFNTDKGIYSCNPKDGSVKTVLKKDGVCGIYADKNILIYNKYDIEENAFVKSGEIRVADFVMAEPCYDKDEVTVRLYNDYDCPVWIIKGGEECDIEKVEPKSLATAEFEGKEIEIFIWKENLEPVMGKVMVSE